MTIDEIIDLEQSLRDYYSPCFNEMDKQESLYTGNFTWKHPPNIQEHKPSIAFSSIQTATDRICSLEYKFKAIPKKDTQEAKEDAEKATQYLNWVWKYVNKKYTLPVVRDIVKHIAMFGMSVVKGPFFDADVFDTNGFLCPIDYWAVDPRTVLLDPSPEPKFGFEVFTRKAIMIENNYTGYVRPIEVKPWDDVDWMEYWSPKERLYLVLSKKGDKENRKKTAQVIQAKEGYEDFIPNIYGYLPYHVAYSGLGMTSVDGSPETRAVGLLKFVESSIIAAARISTAITSRTEEMAWRSRMLKVTGDIDETKINPVFGPGVFTLIPDGVDLQQDAIIPMTADIFKQLSDIKDDIYEGTISRALQGLRAGPGIYTATQQRDLLTSGGVRLNAIISPMLTMLERIGGRTLEMLEKVIQKKVYDCKPSNVNGWYEVEVEVDTITPEEKERRFELGRLLWGFLPPEEIYEKFWGYDNPTAIKTKLYAHEMVKSGMFNEVLQRKALEYLGVDEEMAGIQQNLEGRTPPRGKAPVYMAENPVPAPTPAVPVPTQAVRGNR